MFNIGCIFTAKIGIFVIFASDMNMLVFLQSVAVDSGQTTNVSDSIRVAAETMFEQVRTDPGAFMKDMIDKGIDFGLKLVAAFVIYAVGIWVIRRIKRSVVRGFERRQTEKTLATFVTSVISIALTVLLIILTISTLGINTTSLAAVLAAGGMAVGMALSGTVSNFAGGIMLLIFKPFKAGDYIRAQGQEGIVTELSIFHTKIRTYDNRVIVIPNGVLSNGNIENTFHHSVRRIDMKVNVEYGTDAQKCMDLLVSLVKSDARVLDASVAGAKDPSAFLSELSDSTVVFTVWYWVRIEDYWNVKFDMNSLVYTELPKNGISFAYPHMDIELRNGSR